APAAPRVHTPSLLDALPTLDSEKSPSGAKAGTRTPSTAPVQMGASNAQWAMPTPTAVDMRAEPAYPSHDFLGEMLGAIGCLPKKIGRAHVCTPVTFRPRMPS